MCFIAIAGKSLISAVIVLGVFLQLFNSTGRNVSSEDITLKHLLKLQCAAEIQYLYLYEFKGTNKT